MDERTLSSRTEIYHLIICANVKFWRSEVRDSSVLWTFRIGLHPDAKEIVANLDAPDDAIRSAIIFRSVSHLPLGYRFEHTDAPT